MMDGIIERALERGHTSLSEYESKRIVAMAGVPVTKELLAHSREEAVAFAGEIGYPVVLKGCAASLTHKTESGMVRVNLKSAREVAQAYDELAARDVPVDGMLVQEMIQGSREFVLGVTRDAQFGPCVMFGLGGVFTEALRDVSFRVAPVSELDAEEMIEEIKTRALLDEFRGSPAVDREALVRAIRGLGDLALSRDEIAEVDVNPLIIEGRRPVAVDALVVLGRRDTAAR